MNKKTNKKATRINNMSNYFCKITGVILTGYLHRNKLNSHFKSRQCIIVMFIMNKKMSFLN